VNEPEVGPETRPESRAAKRAATAQRILDAARAEFGERGLEAATIRRIARRANVDPSLVMQHYGSKAALFAIAIQLDDASPGEVEAHLHDVLDVRLAALPPETRALVRSMLTAPEAAESMSAFLNERVANLSRAMGGEDADLRAALIVSSILGLTIARHFLKLDAFTAASDADIARVARPWVTTGVDADAQHPQARTPEGSALDNQAWTLRHSSWCCCGGRTAHRTTRTRRSTGSSASISRFTRACARPARW
jgi:AcrR family transcriptional regulator